MLHIRDRWFSPQATEKKGVRFAQKSHKSFQIKQIRRIKKNLKDLNRFERFLAVGDLKIECQWLMIYLFGSFGQLVFVYVCGGKLQ